MDRLLVHINQTELPPGNLAASQIPGCVHGKGTSRKTRRGANGASEFFFFGSVPEHEVHEQERDAYGVQQHPHRGKTGEAVVLRGVALDVHVDHQIPVSV
eukprot:1175938-Prorocentrum_minimum.AAC.3